MSDAAVAQPAEAAPAPAEAAAATEAAVPDDLPSLEEATPVEGDAEGRGTQSRAEKKIRKALSKFGLTPVKGVYRVTVKKPQSVMFVISNPEVFKSPNSESYVIYGEAKMEDTALSRFQDAAKGLNIPSSLPAEAVAAASAAAASSTAADSSAPSAAPASADGVAETDITLVMSQTGTTRENAIAVLKKHNGDLINSIMELTSVVQG